MTVVGFSFTKIEAEKSETRSSKVNIGNNVSIKEIKDANISLGTEKQKAVKFILESVDKIKKVTDEWQKNKKIDKEVMANILSTVLNKCNIQALILSQEVGLPSPIPLPKLKTENKEE